MPPKPIAKKRSFNGNQGRFIKPEAAAKLTAAFRLAYPQSLRGHVFGQIKVRQLLTQDRCAGIRMYHGLARRTGEVLVLVGVDVEGRDLTSGLILDTSVPCPSYCDTLSVLAPRNLTIGRGACSIRAIQFSGEEGEYVPVLSAAKWTAQFRKLNGDSIKAHFLGRKKLEAVLAQRGSVGLRIYNALDKKKARELVIVGVTRDNRDMTQGLILNTSVPCPSFCDKGSQLFIAE